MPLNSKHALALSLLEKAVAEDPAGKAGVARRLNQPGCGRVMIARVLSPNDSLQISDKLADRVLTVYYVIPVCPGTGAQQPRSECERIASLAAPTHNPQAMRLWKACRRCEHRPVGGESL